MLCKCGCKMDVLPSTGKRQRVFYNATCRKRYQRQQQKDRAEFKNSQDVTKRDNQNGVDQPVTQGVLPLSVLFEIKASPLGRPLYYIFRGKMFGSLHDATGYARAEVSDKSG